MEVLVTGATGFVGEHLVRRLLAEGFGVRGLSRNARRATLPPGAEPVVGDVTEPDSLPAALKGIDAVVHLVAIIVERGDRTYVRVNHLGTENLVRAMRRDGVATLVHQSALGVGPDERFPYLHSKWLGEEAVRSSGLDFTVLRPGVIHGPGAGFFRPIVWNLRWLPVFPLPAGGRTRFQPIHIDDVCTAIVSSLRQPRRDVLDVAGTEIYSFAELAGLVMKALNKPRPAMSIPVWAAKPFAWTQAIRRNPLVTADQLDMVVLDNTTALDVVQRNFGFEPARISGTDLRWLADL